jgi:hypothetical protein
MNNLQRVGIILLVGCLVLFFLSGCAGYDVVYERGEAYEPVVLAGVCGGPATDWPCLEETPCSVI